MRAPIVTEEGFLAGEAGAVAVAEDPLRTGRCRRR